MAEDVRNLLEQLGQPDFEYREFPGTEADASGYWPIFRMIIGHPALRHLAGAQQPFRAELAAPLPPVSQQENAAPPPFVERRVGGPGAMFRRYANQAPVGKPAEAGTDIRDTLRRLSGER